MRGISKDGPTALPSRTQEVPAGKVFPDAPDWRFARSFRIICLTGPDGVPYSVTDALMHPSLRGIRLEAMAIAEADFRLPPLLEAQETTGTFTVLIVDRGAETLPWCRSLAQRFPGDHYHCLALVEAQGKDVLWSADWPATLDALPIQSAPEELASRLRYLGRLAAERARRVSAEREVLGMGQRLNETQSKLKLTRVLEEAVERLQRLSTTDGLTGITNRARFEEMLDLEWGQAVGESMPLSLIMIDIDYFKRYNDSYGHLLGDACLQKVARSLLTARESSHDHVARFGGEEFVVLLPGRPLEFALEVAERLRAGVEALAVPNANSGVSPHITISAGVASAVPDLMSSATGLVQDADRALYLAKREGRNRIAGSIS